MAKKQLVELQNKINELMSRLDAAEDKNLWLSEHLIELNALQEAYNAQSAIFAKQSDNTEPYWNEGTETTIKSWMITPETDYNFQVQLLAECDDLVRWWIGKLNLKFTDDSFYDVFYKAFHIAFLFEPVCFYSDKTLPNSSKLLQSEESSPNLDKKEEIVPETQNNKEVDKSLPDEKEADTEPSGYEVYRISKIEGDKAYIYKAVDFEKDNYTKYITNDDVDSADVIEVPAKDIFVLNLWHYGTIKFGMFVRLIQAGLQHKIYLDRVRQKNESFLQVICDTSEVGRRKPSWITRFFSFFARDKAKDNQNGSFQGGGSTDLTKVKWFSPAEQEKTYTMLNDAIEKEYEKVCQIVGKDMCAADDKQTLAKEANTFGQSYLCIQKFVMAQVFRCLDKMNIQYDTWEFEQVDEEPAGENDNAVKDNPKELHKNQKGAIE